MPYSIPPFINNDPWDWYWKSGSGPVRLSLVLMPPCRLTAAKSFNRKVRVHLWVTTQYYKKQLKRLFMNGIFSDFCYYQHQKASNLSHSKTTGTELYFGNYSQLGSDQKPLSSWTNKHNQRCYTTTVASPNAKRLGPPCNKPNQPARCFKQTVQVCKTYLKTSWSIKGQQNTPACYFIS